MKMVLNLFYLIATLYCGGVHTERVLALFTHNVRSHFMTVQPLLHNLAEKGHHVTVVSQFPSNNPPANYTDINIRGISPIGIEVIDLTSSDDRNKILSMVPSVERIVTQLIEYQFLVDIPLEICTKLVNMTLIKDILQEKYEVILLESFHSDCLRGLMHIYGQEAPVVGVATTMMMPWISERMGVSENPAYVTGCTAGFTDDNMSFMQRMENTFMNLYLKFWHRHFIQIKEQAIIEKHFGYKIPDLEVLGKNISSIIVNTFHSLNGNRPSLPGVIEAGGMHLRRKQTIIPQYIERFLNESGNGVVLFSFGSLIKTSTIPKHKEDMIVKVLSKLKQRVIWKYENSDEEGTLTGNILKVRWLPQYELLQHKKVVAFLAHGGLLGMTEALSAGKPMVVVPFFGDQPTNGAYAERIGFGKMLSYVDMTEESLTEALQKVLSPEMRLSARRASMIWHDKPADPIDTAIYAIERVMRWGHLDPLHSPARDLQLYEYLLLDVAAAFIVALLIMALLVRWAMKLFFKVIIGCFVLKTKKKQD